MSMSAHGGGWLDDIGVGAVLDDAYQLTRTIGEGGMGTVYEAVQLRLRKRVAVKVMVPELAQNPDALARFRREVEITCQLEHPHVIQLLDHGTTHTGQPYLVMEYLQGEDLEQRLQRVGRLSLAATVDIVRQVASALAVIHAQGIVHRDLKPANVFLLPRHLTRDFAKIVDFGICKVTVSENRLTRDFSLVGTPEGMSPEQATGRVDHIDARSDQWALACLVWRMLVGTRPFAGTSLQDIVRRIAYEEPAPLHPRAKVPARVERVLRRALAKRQDDRFPTISAFWLAFEAAAGRQPNRATPFPPRRTARTARLSLLSLAAGAALFYGADRLDLLGRIERTVSLILSR